MISIIKNDEWSLIFGMDYCEVVQYMKNSEKESTQNRKIKYINEKNYHKIELTRDKSQNILTLKLEKANRYYKHETQKIEKRF